MIAVAKRPEVPQVILKSANEKTPEYVNMDEFAQQTHIFTK